MSPWNKGVPRSKESIERYVATRRRNGKFTDQSRRVNKLINLIREHIVGIDLEDARVMRNKIDTMLYEAKLRARVASLPCTITRENIVEVWPISNRCPITLAQFQFNNSHGRTDNSPSLDKIIPKLGYVRGNIAVISDLANKVKHNVTDPEIFERIGAWLRKHQEKELSNAA